MSKTGGACFTPRMEPRPKYPSSLNIIQHTTREYLRDMIFGTVLVLALVPSYTALTQALVPRLGERIFFTIFGSIVHLGSFALTALPLVICDRMDWLKEYKIPRKPSQVASSNLLRALFIEMTIGHFISTPISLYLSYGLFKYFGMPSVMSEPSTSPIFLAWAFALAHFYNDVGFYWSHRLFHMPVLYKHIHKKHHNFVGTIAPAAEFAHIFEGLTANVIPTIAGILFFGRHCLIFWVWLALRLQQTYEAHSGYCFQGTWFDFFLLTHGDGAVEHDHHHTINRGNFGASWLDYLCGTMDSFVAAGGHATYLSLAHRAVYTARGSDM
uniref:Fatty acid hydroxylase domain-containing protein n=1 Tax=Aureoumbra lagunensis TaxID=44058 RepID=A0A7S3NPR6_9STRA